jgi:hypothetical protein
MTMTHPMITITLCLAAAAVGFRCGYFFGRSDRNSGSGEDWRCRFTHESTNRPSGPPPLRLRRSNPFVSEFQQQINDALDGYRSINYPDPSPDRRPTNPYSGEQITLTEGRTQRGNGNGGPTTPKPEIIPRGQWPGGYQPRSYRPGANPPPREP